MGGITVPPGKRTLVRWFVRGNAISTTWDHCYINGSGSLGLVGVIANVHNFKADVALKFNISGRQCRYPADLTSLGATARLCCGRTLC
jgi:hypothetical protein